MPQNAEYMYAAYTVAALLYGGYVTSLWLRSRRIAQREARLDARSDAGRS